MDKIYPNPKITVIMPVYNSEKYIKVAIDSIINQSFTNFEFVIIDDCSSDRSLEIIKSYNDQRIKLLQNETNIGVVKTRNKGLDQSLGKYIAFLDSDDYAYPSRLAEQYEFMENNPDFGMIGSWVEVINEKGDLTGEVWKYMEPHHKIPSILLFHNYFAQSAVLIRKSVLSGDCYKRQRAEDYDLWIKIARKSKVGNIQKILIKYRQHHSSRSRKAVDVIEKNLREIVCEQLNYLGVNPTPEELLLHRQLGSYNNTDMSVQHIKNVADWLKLLRNANYKTGVYTHHEFNQVLADIQLRNLIKSVEIVEAKLQISQAALDSKNSQIQAIENKFQQQKFWIEQLQTGKDWLESQYHIWMQTAQQTQLALEQSQSQLQQTQLALEQSQSQLQQTQLALEQSQSQLQQTQLALEQSQSQLQQTQLSIAEMQSSRFWKLREQWFKLKKLLGLCE